MTDWSQQRIYLAGHYPRRDLLKHVAQELTGLGAEITSRWVYGGEEGKSWNDIATIDLNDVRRASMVLVFTGPYTLQSGEEIEGAKGIGHWIEYGLAYGMKKEIHVIGPTESPLLLMPGTYHWKDYAAFMEAYK
jgi:hypothetical protein